MPLKRDCKHFGKRPRVDKGIGGQRLTTWLEYCAHHRRALREALRSCDGCEDYKPK